jgi:excisionase family DNA binding protein
MVEFPTMLTLKEASEATGLAVASLRKLCHRGKIVYIQSGKKWLVNADSLIKYMQEGENHNA